VIGIVLVAHSAKLAQGVKDLAEQMVRGRVKIAAAGGASDGSLGTNTELIRSAIEEVYSSDGVLVIMDLGSAVMSAEVAVEALDAERASSVLLSNAPFVEGAIVAVVEAATGKTLQEVNSAAERAYQMQKVER
jgi:dihydroxyacetone kinase phosphotransfer subunit